MSEPNSDLKPVEIQELPQVSAGHGGGCACGHEDDGGLPELDATVIPHAIRHATIFGALDSIHPGHGMVLAAPHDPKPLLAQLEQRSPDAFAIDYVQQGPEVWKLRFLRK